MPATTTFVTATGLRTTGRLLVALLVTVLTMVALPGASGQDPSAPGSAGLVRVVVSAPDAPDAVATLTEALGGRPVGPATTRDGLGAFGMTLIEIPGAGAEALAADPRVAAVTPDMPLHLADAGFASDRGERGAADLVSELATVDADDAWAEGHTGEDVGVVLVDTGVSEHPDLAGDIVASVDLTRERDGVDRHGHGTFLAGLIAGDGAGSHGRYGGVAPDAHLVSVKVAGADGSTSLAQVLTGLAVADRARADLDAPVVLLALSRPASEIPDPVTIAAEMLWTRGSTVVVAAGNDGEAGPGTVTAPGVDPYLVTVGALDDNGTPGHADDAVAPFSSRGPTPAGHSKPDLLAPGVSTVGLRAVGSTIDAAHPDAVVDQDYLRGSGTSMAAALAAGAAAAVLGAEPGLTPDEVKGRLTSATAPAPAGAEPTATGHGVLDVDDAVVSRAPAANQDLPRPPTPLEEPGVGRDRDTAGSASRGPAPAGWRWTGWRWTDREWTGWRWTDQDWAGWRWTDDAWTGWRWTGWRWTDHTWTGWRWTGWRWTAGGFGPTTIS